MTEHSSSGGRSFDAGAAVEYVRNVYGLTARGATFLPDVSDADVVTCRVDCDEGPHFLKLRNDRPPPPLARYLADAGISEVLAPLTPPDPHLPATIGERSAVLYPYIEGQNAFRRPLSLEQWTSLGKIVASIHALSLPRDIAERMRHETYAGAWRGRVRRYLAVIPPDAPDDAATHGLAGLLSNRRPEIAALVDHADALADALRRRTQPIVPCHGDLHAGNVLVADTGSLFIVDWDDPVLAPRERDLMFVGAGIGGAWDRPEESAAFHRGYGAVTVDRQTLAFYRCDRIVEDIAVFCDQLFVEHGEDAAMRETRLGKLASAFHAGDVVEIALRTVAGL